MFLKSVNETAVPLYHHPLFVPAWYQVQLWIPQAGQFGLFLPQQVLSPVGRTGLDMPWGEDLAPAGPAMFPVVHEEPVEKGMKGGFVRASGK